MDMQMEVGILLAYALGMLLLYVLGYALLMPVKLLLRLVINSVAGGVCVVLINFVGSFFGFHLALNLFSAITVGFLGVPGVILWVLLTHIL